MADGASPRRRLPTKASSGRITLPPSPSPSLEASPVIVASDDEPSSRSADELSRSSQPTVILNSMRSTTSDDERASSSPASLSGPSESANVVQSPLSLQPPSASTSYGPPRQAPKPPPLKTGPLNSTSTPQAQSLPVKRRGSYQSLKRHTPNAGEQTSVIGMIKKATHWERFGTILVLGCLRVESADGESILQMLQAEGYDTVVSGIQQEAIAEFCAREVFPDVVLVDSDIEAISTIQLIRQLQSQNPTVAILCIGSREGKMNAVSALQAGAADFMYKPTDLDEMVARIERHVQRQHCIKLELETAMEDAKAMMAQLSAATTLGDMVLNKTGQTSQSGGRLIAVAETDFEQQMTELAEENHKLDSKLQDMENKLMDKDDENRLLAEKLNQLELRMSADSTGVQGQLCSVAEQNHVLMDKMNELEKMVRRSQEFPH